MSAVMEGGSQSLKALRSLRAQVPGSELPSRKRAPREQQGQRTPRDTQEVTRRDTEGLKEVSSGQAIFPAELRTGEEATEQMVREPL